VCRQVLGEERPDDDVDAVTRAHGGGRRQRWLIGSEGRHPLPGSAFARPRRTLPHLPPQDGGEVRGDGGGGGDFDDRATAATVPSSLHLFFSTRNLILVLAPRLLRPTRRGEEEAVRRHRGE
jgi:hypothetical protein